jgi:hypothetical protein
MEKCHMPLKSYRYDKTTGELVEIIPEGKDMGWAEKINANYKAQKIKLDGPIPNDPMKAMQELIKKFQDTPYFHYAYDEDAYLPSKSKTETVLEGKANLPNNRPKTVGELLIELNGLADDTKIVVDGGGQLMIGLKVDIKCGNSLVIYVIY